MLYNYETKNQAKPETRSTERKHGKDRTRTNTAFNPRIMFQLKNSRKEKGGNKRRTPTGYQQCEANFKKES